MPLSEEVMMICDGISQGGTDEVGQEEETGTSSSSAGIGSSSSENKSSKSSAGSRKTAGSNKSKNTGSNSSSATSSTTSTGGTSASSGTSKLLNQGVGKSLMQYLISNGYTKEQAIGFAANVYGESWWKVTAVGDSGNSAGGLIQWHSDRRKVLCKKVLYKYYSSSDLQLFSAYNASSFAKKVTMERQFECIVYELKNVTAYKGLEKCKDANAAVHWCVYKYELPKHKDSEVRKRSKFIADCRKILG